MSELKERLRADLSAAMKARDTTAVRTLRMALSAISTEAFAASGREELARRERAEGEVLASYLPAQLSEEELAALAARAVDEVAAELGERPGPRQMGQVMKVATAQAAGRAEGSRLAAAVKPLLGG